MLSPKVDRKEFPGFDAAMQKCLYVLQVPVSACLCFLAWLLLSCDVCVEFRSPARPSLFPRAGITKSTTWYSFLRLHSALHA